MGGWVRRDCKEENFGYIGKGKFLIPPDRLPNTAVRFFSQRQMGTECSLVSDVV